MSTPASRLDRDFCAQGFVRAAQYFANMLTTVDVLAESLQVIHAIFGPDLVRFCRRSPDMDDWGLSPLDREPLHQAIHQVFDTGFMALETNTDPLAPYVYVLLPVNIRGQIDAVLFVGYAGESLLPAHVLEVFLGVAGLVGASLTRQRAATELQSSLQRTRLILEAVGEGVCGMDGAGLITFVNLAALNMIGCGEEALVGRSGEVLLQGMSRTPNPDSPLPRVLNQPPSAPPVKGEAILFRHDGTPFPAEFVCVPLVADGRVCGLVMTFADISERKQSEDNLRQTIDELARSNTELERFAYIASHDLREPLRTVISFTQLLERRFSALLNDEGREYLGFIVGGAKRMNTLVEDILIYSRVATSGKSFEPVDANTVMDEVVEILSHVIGDHQAVVTWRDLPTVAADRSQLLQLLENLVSNGLKFVRRGIVPELSVSALRHGRFWEFSVQDNGIGVEPQYFEQIFVIFKRLHTDAAYPGSGIGLAICKRIVERHGGRIWVVSTPRQGTCFHFTLPAAASEAGA